MDFMEFVLVLEPAISTLYDDINSQFFVGRNIQAVMNKFLDLVFCVKQLHDLKIVHCNIKPKNILELVFFTKPNIF